MKRYLCKKAGAGVLTILASVFINFMLIHLAPGDPIKLLTGQDKPAEEMVAALRHKYGLDQPLIFQFFDYLKALLHGDLGTSILSNRPVLSVIGERFGPTMLLAFSTAVIAVVVGTALGIYCARRNGSKLDGFLSSISYLCDSMPDFWLGLMFILLFALTLHIFPTAGMISMRNDYHGFRYVLDVLYHLVLPALTLSIIRTPYFFRIARSSVLQVLSDDFVTTLRATGMSEKRIFYRYVFKNSILPTITIFGITLAYIVTGVAIIEIVFSWPGIGSVMLTAIMQRDYPLLMGIYLILSVSVAVAMILIDVVYAILDPRIRYN